VNPEAMGPSEKAAWGVAVVGWFIGIFRYIFSAGALAARIKGVEDKVESMHDRIDGLASGQIQMVGDIGEIKGELKRINRTKGY